MLKTDIVTLKAVGWLSAPVVTSFGFAIGAWLNERLHWPNKLRWRVWLWPLVGCSAGAAAVFWLGPMLIVFGMFVGGTACIVLREIHLLASCRCAGDADRSAG